MTIRNEQDFDGWVRTAQPITLVVPATLPSEERAATLRRLWDEHVRLIDGDWKGRVEAIVPGSIMGDVQEAMEFMGAIVDLIGSRGAGIVRLVRLYSDGYRAHGF